MKKLLHYLNHNRGPITRHVSAHGRFYVVTGLRITATLLMLLIPDEPPRRQIVGRAPRLPNKRKGRKS